MIVFFKFVFEDNYLSIHPLLWIFSVFNEFIKIIILAIISMFFRLYPVDKTRVNEYGMSFEDDTKDKGKQKDSKKTK